LVRSPAVVVKYQMDSFHEDNAWTSQADGPPDPFLDLSIPFDLTSPREGYQTGSHTTSATSTGAQHQLSSVPHLTAPVVQTYQTMPMNLPHVAFSPYTAPLGPSQVSALSTFQPTIVLCRLCGQVTGTAALATGSTLFVNGSYSLLPTVDGRRQG
jgi:hypothetical protein